MKDGRIAKKVVIIAFNFGFAGRYVNGPGICLYNLYNILKKHTSVDVKIFTKMRAHGQFNSDDIFSIDDKEYLSECIKNCDILHHWSGLANIYSNIIKFANFCNKKVIIGPNVIDTVDFSKENKFLSKINYDRVLLVNNRIKYRALDFYGIDSDLLSIFMVGPDLDLWSPSDICNEKILWKGNSAQGVKDVSFGVEVSKNLPQYDFDFVGHPTPYNYFKHIGPAKEYKLFFSTSMSETMGMGLAEQWAAGIPSITHPKIYLHGENYITGIITDRSVSAYCDAIVEIMENPVLYKNLSLGARKYMEDNFSHESIASKYLSLL